MEKWRKNELNAENSHEQNQGMSRTDQIQTRENIKS